MSEENIYMIKKLGVCPCGNPGIKWKKHAWCCKRCDDIETKISDREKADEEYRKLQIEIFRYSQAA